MPSTMISLTENELVKLMLEFLGSRDLDISMLALERETGVVNGNFSDDLLFLRQLVLDGQWDDVLDFIQPLSSVESFDVKTFKYRVLRHKYLELLCIKCEAGPLQESEFTVEQVVSTLTALEPFCPSREDYQHLCFLLTLKRLSDEPEFQRWNPSLARVQCFQQVLPLVAPYLDAASTARTNGDAGPQPVSPASDRLVTLVVKGLLYETCVDYCQRKAIGGRTDNSPRIASVLNPSCSPSITDADLSLLSWLQSIPPDTFSCPFENKALRVNIQRLKKPELEASWSEQILATPIKPNVFPHSAMPATRKSIDLISRSLNPQFDGLSHGLTGNRRDSRSRDVGGLSKSIAGFHLGDSPKLAQKTTMHSSINRMFVEKDEEAPEDTTVLPREKREQSPKPREVSRHSTTSSSSGASKEMSPSPQEPNVRQSGADLFREYQRQRETLQREMEERERRRQELLSGLADESPSGSAEPVVSADDLSAQRRPIGPIVRPTSTLSNTDAGGAGDADSVEMNRRRQDSAASAEGEVKPKFMPVTTVEDQQAIRAVCFDPTGKLYALGSNSKTLRVCAVPDTSALSSRGAGAGRKSGDVVFKRSKHHRGSIYCIAWSARGNLIASGSNDKCLRLVKYDPDENSAVGEDAEWAVHDGTIRDVIFVSDKSGSPLLVSGGAGDRICVTDCETGTPVRKLEGHTGAIYSLSGVDDNVFVSGSADSTARIWDVRSQIATQVVAGYESAFAAVSTDPTGQVLASGHEDNCVSLYDVRGGRFLQTLRHHSGEVRSVRFAPSALYLLSGAYDHSVALSDLHADLLEPIPGVKVGTHGDKVIQARWHPSHLAFVSTSADKTAQYWALPS